MRLSDSFRVSLEQMTSEFQKNMSDEVRTYLAGRGLDAEVAERYRLGQVTHASALGKAGYAGMIAIPYLTAKGGVVNIKLRRFPADGPGEKYLAPLGQRIYNTLALDRADEESRVAIVSGEFDALILDYHLNLPTVGIPGDRMWQAHPEWKSLFQGYRDVYLFPDNDESGKALANGVSNDIPELRQIILPYKDVTETYVHEGAQSIRERAGLDG